MYKWCKKYNSIDINILGCIREFSGDRIVPYQYFEKLAKLRIKDKNAELKSEWKDGWNR